MTGWAVKIFKLQFICILCLITTSLKSQEGIRLYNSATQLFNEGKYLMSIDTYSHGIILNDIAKSANYLGRARCYEEIGKYAKAKRDLKSCLKMEHFNSDKINSSAYWLLALIASVEKNNKNELTYFMRAIQYDPNNDELKASFGLTLIENRKYVEALEVLTLVIQNAKNIPYAYNNRALAYISLQKYSEAKADLEISMKLDPENPFLYKNLFSYYIALGNKSKACEALEIALQKDMADYGLVTDRKQLTKFKKKYCKKVKLSTK